MSVDAHDPPVDWINSRELEEWRLVDAIPVRQQIAPKLHNVLLDADDFPAAFEQAEARGARGGAICDYQHLVAARNAWAKRFHTLNLNVFLSFHRPEDPEILSP